MKKKLFWLFAIIAIIAAVVMAGAANPAGAQADSGGVSKLIDVNIGTQTLTQLENGVPVHSMHISSGGEYYYRSGGHRYLAHTPRGTFTIGRHIGRWRCAKLGCMYMPMYFIGGYAIHGSKSVPDHPASHGCVRIPISETEALYNWAEIGTTVQIHD